jgi:hypothetical protein
VGLPVSLVLIAVGAVLAFAVNQDPDPAVDIDVVGWVLMGVGFVGILLSLFWWERLGPGYWGWDRGYPRSGRYPPRRRTVIEEEDGPPGPPPPEGPPPP